MPNKEPFTLFGFWQKIDLHNPHYFYLQAQMPVTENVRIRSLHIDHMQPSGGRLTAPTTNFSNATSLKFGNT